MTDGEKMIWAAAFALEMSKEAKETPRHLLPADSKAAYKEWHRDFTIGAMEAAGCAVKALRENAEAFRDQGSSDRFKTMLDSMLGK